jgi:uncharacterized RDD family membrane protein YckC
VAALVDLALLGLVQFSLGLVGGRVWGRDVSTVPVFHAMVVVFTIVFFGLYSTVLHAAGGQTLGKLVAGVRVIDVDGEPLTVGAALLRWFAYFVSLAPLGTGFLMAGLRRDKRALHDLIAGSRVERERRPLPAAVGPVGAPTSVT